ncbi:MAG: F0F1 ATP synthase subunit alpha [Lachnospiraceae bacterium]|nr:F0F1 ATP synthase subunit alpha [Lachnospiraceae bacterium]
MKHATLYCVTPPSEAQLARMKAFLAKEEGDPDIVLDVEIETSLVSGFILRTESKVYDWSMYGRVEQLRGALGVVHGRRPKKTVANLKKCIEEFELAAGEKEYGTVSFVGDGIAVVTGLDHACYGEIVTFACGVKGMVMDIRREEIGVILFGRDTEIFEGSQVTRTGRMAGMPVGDSFIGRIVDALGNPLDGLGEIVSSDFRPLENPAPGIMDRQPVTTSLETGILAIDSMFPIGRGQRELIIGDRQTGKTSIALDTILNQKGKNVVCIYVAIGQKASTIAKMVTRLREAGAMDYTVIVTSTASEPAPLQYIAPYSGTALAEYFMYSGRDVLIVYDDLSKHAVSYRAISLLLERSPGREAYPGDVFYLHSRLLERASRLSDELGGGSITALPIIETQNGDVSAYIPTNVISITDGQIYLESELFFEGQRPAVNVGLSVSRVGGAAQASVMKQASGTVRIDLAQYREMEVFTQFSSELDESTKRQLAHGRALMELLKQPLGHALSMPEQVLLLQAANRRLFEDLSVRELAACKYDYLKFMKVNYPEILTEIAEGDKLRKSQLEHIDDAGAKWLAQRGQE